MITECREHNNVNQSISSLIPEAIWSSNQPLSKCGKQRWNNSSITQILHVVEIYMVSIYQYQTQQDFSLPDPIESLN